MFGEAMFVQYMARGSMFCCSLPYMVLQFTIYGAWSAKFSWHVQYIRAPKTAEEENQFFLVCAIHSRTKKLEEQTKEKKEETTAVLWRNHGVATAQPQRSHGGAMAESRRRSRMSRRTKGSRGDIARMLKPAWLMLGMWEGG